ncbi:hypothetical protein EOL96_00685 [Candidatus Saccharibacteria bacterium]|nr:hypothetical protein [Candidatus Saccharibacteria bacterium]
MEARLKLNKAKKLQERHLVGMLYITLEWAVIAGIVYWAFPGDFPVTPRNLFWTGKSVAEAAMASWPILAWGLVVSLLLSLFTERSRADKLIASTVHKYNMALSVQAGVLEELTHRYFAFIAMIGIIPMMNWVLFGWYNSGLLHWLYATILIPMSNWLTAGNMSDLLTTTPWYVGAALLSANAMFRDGHKHLGLLGFVNSWYVGMFLFWVMLQYGLLAAITVHIVYDVIVFSMERLDATVFKRH